jgi:hypothetical protein
LAIGDTDANQSNQGWGPWETNVAKVLSQDAAGVADAGRITAIAVDSSDSGTQDPTPLIAIALCRNEVIDEVFRFEVAKDADPAIVRPAEFVVLSNPS